MELHTMSDPMTLGELKERDLFNQRQGAMNKNIECISKDFDMYTKKVSSTSNQIRNIDFLNIGISNMIVICVIVLSILQSVINLNSLFSGISIACLSGFDFIKNLSLLMI